ncbi:MAG TPA: alpha-L-arabinofuranosidase C-terminal domain-containing protein [Sphingomicrobium sp.]|nr:alpha-L-arabinofuranosidase C-terminal domain-containing protein [Sphingomicrobium sp.]
MAIGKSLKHSACVGIAALLAFEPLIAAPAPSEHRIAIDATKAGPTISRDIFGQFAEHLGSGIYGGIWVGRGSPIANVRGIRSDVVQALRAIEVPNVRWPGGCFADNYHWRNGIGPQDKRPQTLNPDWGGVIEPNSFGTDEYFDFLGQIGADAFISENIGSGTAQESADWFEYMTSGKPTTLANLRAANGHAAPYRIKYLGLGNESWGCGGAMSPDHYVEEMKRFSHYTRNYNPAQQSGSAAMKRIAVGWDSGNSDYTEAVMKAWKDKVWSWDIEGVSLHGYTIPNSWEQKGPSFGFGESEYAKAIRATLKMKDWIARETAIMDRYDPDRKVGLYIDEWGIWTDPNPGTNPGFLQQQNTLRDAVIAGLNLDIFMRNAERVRGSNIAQMVNVLQAMILTDGPRMVRTPTYYVYRMYVPFHDATLVPVAFDPGSYIFGTISVPQVDAVAARDKAGNLWLATINVDPDKPAHFVASISGISARDAAGELLTSSRVDAHNSFESPNTVIPRTFAGHVARGTVEFDLPPAAIAVVQVR